MLPPNARAPGFTLIELLISIALGLVLMLTAFSAVRVTSQAIIASRRIALENALLRTGVEEALDEVDFWTVCDNPDDPTKQAMRGQEASGGWLPFAPFAVTPDAITHGGFIDTKGRYVEVAASALGWSADLLGGWNPSPLAWAAWDPRAWPRFCPAEESHTTECWGTGGIYENLDPTLSWHHWYAGQVRGLLDGLGFFGTYEYLPSNGFIAYHGSTAPLGAPNALSWGGIPTSLLQNGMWLDCNDGGDFNVKARVRNTNGTRVFMPGPAGLPNNVARTWASVGYNGRDTGFSLPVMRTFLDNSAASARLLGQEPSTWPAVSFVVRRFVERGSMVNACEVDCTSPLTGSAIAIPFACVGTSLRGARQQRLPGVGWVVDAAHDATLDYGPQP